MKYQYICLLEADLILIFEVNALLYIWKKNQTVKRTSATSKAAIPISALLETVTIDKFRHFISSHGV